MTGLKNNYQKLDIVVTGGAGYIGSVLVPYLLNAGHRVRVIDDLRYGGHGLTAVLEHPWFGLHKIDIRDKDNLYPALQYVDIVIHLAAIVGKPACFEDKYDAWSTNYGGTCYLVEVAEALGVKQFIFASTCSNYGICDLATEETPVDPLSLYSQTKVEAEEKVLSSKIPVTTILRFATAYGISPRMRFDLLLNEFVRDALNDRLEVYGPSAWRPLVHVYDIARAIGLSIREELSGIFNIGGHNLTKKDIADLVQALYPQSQINIRYDKDKKDPRNYRVSFEKIGRLGFTPLYTPGNSVVEIAWALETGIFGDPYNARYRNDNRTK